MDIDIVVPSMGRAKKIKDLTLKHFPDALVCVPESQEREYRKVTPNLLVHPDSIKGIVKKRAWIRNNYKTKDILVMMDDDLKCVYALTGRTSKRIKCPIAKMNLIKNAAQCAIDIKAPLFGFNRGDIRKYSPFKPFMLTGWMAGFVGFTEPTLNYDNNLIGRGEDIDLGMQALLQFRYIYIDNRFKFTFEQWRTPGGNSAFRDIAIQNQDSSYLQQKWGKYIEVKKVKTCEQILLKVKR